MAGGIRLKKCPFGSPLPLFLIANPVPRYVHIVTRFAVRGSARACEPIIAGEVPLAPKINPAQMEHGYRQNVDESRNKIRGLTSNGAWHANRTRANQEGRTGC